MVIGALSIMCQTLKLRLLKDDLRGNLAANLLIYYHWHQIVIIVAVIESLVLKRPEHDLPPVGEVG